MVYNYSMIAIFGAPGSGKTRQAQLFAQKYGWEVATSRSLFIAMRDKDISLALSHGIQVADDKSIEVMAEIFHQYDAYNNWDVVLDGFPSSVAQIYWMRENDYLKHLDGAIILRVPRGELWVRMMKRGRADDTRAAIERRQDLYDRSITGMIHVLRENGIRVEEINGCNAPEDVLERMEEKLMEWRVLTR